MVNSDVLPRHGFTQMVRNMRCQLYFPFPTEQVVLLRTGVLVHINAYMRSLGLTPPAADQAAAPPAKPQPTHADSHAAAAGPSFLKAQIASAGSAGLRDHGPMHSNGVAHTNAMDVDLPGECMTVQSVLCLLPAPYVEVTSRPLSVYGATIHLQKCQALKASSLSCSHIVMTCARVKICILVYCCYPPFSRHQTCMTKGSAHFRKKEKLHC